MEQIELAGNLRYHNIPDENTQSLKGRVRCRIKGVMDSFYFELCLNNNRLSAVKSPNPSMENATYLSAADVLQLYPMILKKTKNDDVKNFLKYIIGKIQHRTVQTRPSLIDTNLMTYDFSGKTEPLHQPFKKEEETATVYDGALTGGIYYCVKIENNKVIAFKNTAKHLLNAKECSRDEIRFLLGALSEKYPENETLYHALLTGAENFWEQEDLRLLKQEFRTNPIAFLNAHEIIKPVQNIGPVFYRDKNGIMHITAKLNKCIYHMTADPNAPVMEQLTHLRGKTGHSMRPSIVGQIICALPDDLPPEQENAVQIIITACNSYTQPPRHFNVQETLETDMWHLAASLKPNDVYQLYQAGAYPQLTNGVVESSLPQRITQNRSLMKRVLKETIHTR